MAVMKGLDNAVIRTAPIFTNVRNLWHSHLKLHEVGVQQHGEPVLHARQSAACALSICNVLVRAVRMGS